ncbi:MAG: L-serine ammonia-lyase, iron-sulfur-dependent, subunit alpha [Bacilli bacterium]
MKSLRELYRIGHGPSSSHAVAPGNAALFLKQHYPQATNVVVTLYESFAYTGKGHLTDRVIIEGFAPIPCEIIFDKLTKTQHPNTFDVTLTLSDQVIQRRVVSLGGGAYQINDPHWQEPKAIYPHRKLTDILQYCTQEHLTLPQYVERFEGKDIWTFLTTIWNQMQKTILEGITTEGILPGTLKVIRKAKTIYEAVIMNNTPEVHQNRLISAYAFAVNEVNAAGGIVVTAPTCGASGTMPALLKYVVDRDDIPEQKVLEGLAVGGIIGNLIKHNASISGAEAGCQAEVGSACSMAAATYAYLLDMNTSQIEYAAEVAMEHHLGLTCDPIQGYVQIPCIERNAMAALRAMDAAQLANVIADSRKISFDLIVDTMYQTGKDMDRKYRETSKGGLAKKYRVS